MRVEILHNNQPSKIDLCFQQSFNQTQKWCNQITFPIIWFGDNNHAVVIQSSGLSHEYVLCIWWYAVHTCVQYTWRFVLNECVFVHKTIGLNFQWLASPLQSPLPWKFFNTNVFLEVLLNLSVENRVPIILFCVFCTYTHEMFGWTFWLTLKTSFESKYQIDFGLCFWPKYGRLY